MSSKLNKNNKREETHRRVGIKDIVIRIIAIVLVVGMLITPLLSIMV